MKRWKGWIDMFPMIGRIRIYEDNRKKIGLWLPLFLVWPIMIVLMIVFAPLILLIKIVAMILRKKSKIHIFGPLMLYLIWHLRGLEVDIKSENNNQVYVCFK